MLKKIKIVSLLVIALTSSSNGQDTQYWNKQYGTYGELLSGVVVGGVADLSSTFYNPGAMSFRDTNLILSTGSMQFIYIDRKDVGESKSSLKSYSLQSSPSILALKIPIKGLGNNQFAASYITRYSFNYEADGIRIDDFINSSSNEDQSYNSNGIFVSHSLSEYWPGLTWSNKLNSNIGLGTTLYIPIRSQSGQVLTLVQNYNNQTGSKSIFLIDSYSYFNVRMLLKVGMIFNLEPLMMGFSLTTPSINLFGLGSIGVNVSNTIIDPDIHQKLPEMASNYQDDLPTRFNSPLSVAIGTAYYYDKTVLYFSAEWFNRVDSFNIMEPDDFKAKSNGETISHDLSYELKSVFNFGFGIKHTLSESFTYYGGITKDESAYVKGSINKFAVSHWNIIHIRSGAKFNIDNLSITFGLGYGFSGQFFDRLSIFRDDNNEEDNVNFQEIDVVFGLSYNLLPDWMKL